jgi:c-di-GMP phosphodiesterase
MKTVLLIDDDNVFLLTIGVRIAIDILGAGYSSLGYLSRLPVDRLKLDKALIRRLTTSAT